MTIHDQIRERALTLQRGDVTISDEDALIRADRELRPRGWRPSTTPTPRGTRTGDVAWADEMLTLQAAHHHAANPALTTAEAIEAADALLTRTLPGYQEARRGTPAPPQPEVTRVQLATIRARMGGTMTDAQRAACEVVALAAAAPAAGCR